MKFRNLSLLFVLLFLSTGIFAQKAENYLLWKLSGNGLSTPSYIMGTMHMMPKKEYQLPAKFDETFKTCKILVMEVDMDLSLKEQLALADKVKYPEGKSLQSYMTDEEYQEYRTYFLETLGIKKRKLNRYENLRPFYAYSLIMKDLIPGKMVLMEKDLGKKAKKNKMETAGLETVVYQMDLVDGIAIEDQIDMFLLSDDPDSKDGIVEEFNKTIKLYQDQNLDQMLAMNKDDDSEAGKDFYQKFLVNRNHNWIPQIEKISKKQPAFYAVGAAHLAGDEGVISLLRQKGYTLTPVK